ncbi:MAG: hypothetical protein FD170_3922 [Bacteroidetes bacterium]|nr:MAG: hypothetical protein FD170_3922 [Bacteroidota bacterium]
MRTDQNKHGPDIDIGVWYAALLRHSTDISGNSAAGKAARAGPDGDGILIPPRKHGEIDARGDPRVSVPATIGCNASEQAKAEKRRRKRWRSTIVEGRTGESPPGNVKELIMNYIDSAARSRLPARGHLLHGDLMADFGLMGGVCPEVERSRDRRRLGTKEGRGTKLGTRDEVEQSYTSEETDKWLSA